MPSDRDDYKFRCERLKQRKAKLIAMGINPRSLKFMTLLHRRKA